MRVTVQYLGHIRALVHTRAEEVNVPSVTTIFELLKRLTRLYGDEFRQEVFADDGGVREGIIVTINGKAIGQLQGIKTSLHPGDTIAILPLFAGGG